LTGGAVRLEWVETDRKQKLLQQEVVVRISLLFACLLVVGMVSSASAEDPTPLELIGEVGEGLLEDYSRPLVESYAVAMGSGWYNSAKSHKLLGFDIGVRFMYIQIPDHAKYFTAESLLVVGLKPDSTGIETTYVTAESLATIFGPRGTQNHWLTENQVGVPPAMPGGLGLNAMPFLLPQASLGLPFGFELTARYIPWPFKGTTVQFMGFGLKSELTALPGLKGLPFSLALQGFYQKVIIGDKMNSNTFGGNLHLSRSFLMVAPYVGFGFDNTSMNFDYVFEAHVPKFEAGPPPRVLTDTVEIPVRFSYSSGMSWRGVVGAKVKLGLFFISADYGYDIAKSYHSVNVGAGIGMR
jgi:hypothetical protein